MKTIYLLFFLLCTCLEGGERLPSYPFVSGDSFRAKSDFIYDEVSREMDPRSVREGNVIFVKIDYLDEFIKKVHPHIENRYILITHNGDQPIPGPFVKLLNDPKLIAWFGQNLDKCNHPKIHPIPIGLANRYWPHGNIQVVSDAIKRLPNLRRSILLYMNFAEGTFPTERSKVAKMFQSAHYCVISKPKAYRDYLEDLGKSKFVLSPRGNGLDCHRTWESLLMGAIPIVRSSSLDHMFENLPVLIVKDWREVNRIYLREKYLQIRSQTFQMEKLYFDYWWNQIESCRASLK